MRRAYATAYPHRPVPTDAELVELGHAEVLSFVDEDVEREAEIAEWERCAQCSAEVEHPDLDRCELDDGAALRVYPVESGTEM